jgi:hypothetical protein
MKHIDEVEESLLIKVGGAIKGCIVGFFINILLFKIIHSII